MASKITTKIKVKASSSYNTYNSYPSENRFVFRYDITIHNHSCAPIKLLSRRWVIYDVGFGYTEVGGSGVIGLMPIIEAGENFNYFSNIILKSGIGKMYGSYLFENLETKETFEVEVPMFQLFSLILDN